MLLLLMRFNAQLMSYIFDEKGLIRVEEEKCRLPVDIRGSKTSELKLSIRSAFCGRF